MGSGVYKSGQGYYTRMGTVVGVSLLAALGLLWLWDYAARVRIGDVNRTYIAAGIVIAVGAAITGLMYWFVYRNPRTSDFLIATEAEMKKVNWSTRREITGSTVVVILTMLFVTFFVFFVDKIFVLLFSSIRVLDM